MNYYFDTEFLDDGKTIDLISIGIVDADDREYYAVSEDFDERRATDWLRKKVLAHIPKTFRRKPSPQIAKEVAEFIQPKARLWGWYPSYDWVALCQLYGPMIARPPHFPKRPEDLKQTVGPKWRGPKQSGTKHNALEDAKYVRDMHRAWTLEKMEAARSESIEEAVKAPLPRGEARKIANKLHEFFLKNGNYDLGRR